MSFDSREDVVNIGLDTEHTPLLGPLRNATRHTSKADQGSSSDDDSTSMEGRVSNTALKPSVVDTLGPGLDPGLQHRLNVSETGYGSVNGNNGSDQDLLSDSSLPSEQLRSAEDVPSKYIGVSVGRFWLIFSGVLAAYFVSPVVR